MGMADRAVPVWILATTVALALLQPFARCARADDAAAERIAAGRKFAARVCGACHVVTSDPDEIPLRRVPAPSFTDLAKRSNVTEPMLRRVLASHHGLGSAQTMPNPRLADYEVDEVVAYLLSLKSP
jgi:mono/diheme cytochrome c family protein